MNTLVILDHPYTLAASENVEHHRAFSSALCKALIQKCEQLGDSVSLIDLHAENFNPVMSEQDLKNWRAGIPMSETIARYQQRMLDADRIVFVFPIWWEVMPAMTKGFIDKVYAKNILYDQPAGGGRMKTRLKKGVQIRVVSVMGTPAPIYKFIMKNPLKNMFQRGICFKTGIRDFKLISYSQVDEMTLEKRTALLRDIEIS